MGLSLCAGMDFTIFSSNSYIRFRTYGDFSLNVLNIFRTKKILIMEIMTVFRLSRLTLESEDAKSR
jgi:hypothetical protein